MVQGDRVLLTTMHRIPDPTSERLPRSFGPARIPADLSADERVMAQWFRHLPRVAGDEELRERILADVLVDSAGTELALVADRAGVEARRSWGWVMATAAALLVSLGVLAVGSSGSSTRLSGVQATGTQASGVTAASGADIFVMDDPNLALFHDLETFDGLGAEPGDVLALDR